MGSGVCGVDVEDGSIFLGRFDFNLVIACFVRVAVLDAFDFRLLGFAAVVGVESVCGLARASTHLSTESGGDVRKESGVDGVEGLPLLA